MNKKELSVGGTCFLLGVFLVLWMEYCNMTSPTEPVEEEKKATTITWEEAEQLLLHPPNEDSVSFNTIYILQMDSIYQTHKSGYILFTPELVTIHYDTNVEAYPVSFYHPAARTYSLYEDAGTFHYKTMECVVFETRGLELCFIQQ